MRTMGLVLCLLTLGGVTAASPDPLAALARRGAAADAPLCPARYLALAPQCLREASGPCVLGLARKASERNDCVQALRLARLCLCDDSEAAALDPAATCEWLRGGE
jgi:hypothetical protein